MENFLKTQMEPKMTTDELTSWIADYIREKVYMLCEKWKLFEIWDNLGLVKLEVILSKDEAENFARSFSFMAGVWDDRAVRFEILHRGYESFHIRELPAPRQEPLSLVGASFKFAQYYDEEGGDFQKLTQKLEEYIEFIDKLLAEDAKQAQELEEKFKTTDIFIYSKLKEVL